MLESSEHTFIEARCELFFGQAEYVRKFWDEPIDICRMGDRHHLELSLLPMSEAGRCCFVDHWNPQRFEPFGEIFLVPANHKIRAQSQCRHQNSIACNFEPNAVNQWFDRDIEWTDSRLQNVLDITNGRIRNLLFQIGEEIKNPGFASETMAELMAAQVALELARFVNGIDEQSSAGGLSPWRLNLIDECIAEVDAQPSLAELAELCDLSIRHLTRAFKASRGRSLGNYIAEKRADKAKQLIMSGASIKAVAYTMGFSAPSNFTTAFVRATGETPRQYRLRVNSGTARIVGRRNKGATQS